MHIKWWALSVGVKTECQFVYFKSHTNKTESTNLPRVQSTSSCQNVNDRKRKTTCSLTFHPTLANSHTNVPNRCIESSTILLSQAFAFLGCLVHTWMGWEKQKRYIEQSHWHYFIPFDIHFLHIRSFQLAVRNTYLIQNCFVIFSTIFFFWQLANYRCSICNTATCRKQQNKTKKKHWCLNRKLYLILTEYRFIFKQKPKKNINKQKNTYF